MSTSSSFENVKDLLADGQTEAASDLLLKFCKTGYPSHYHTALLIKNQLETLQQQVIEGLLSHEEEKIQWARISKGVLELVENIEKGESPIPETEISSTAELTGNRQLAAILFTDIVGYTAMMRQDEQQAIAAVKRHQQLIESSAAACQGKVLQYYGDGSLSIFQSAIAAVRCAIELQRKCRQSPQVPLRIGIHIGEILLDDGKVYGDGVNVASRIETLGVAGAVLFSKEVYRKIRNHPEFKTISLGLFDFKNVDERMEVFALANEGFPIPKREEMEGKVEKQKHVPEKAKPFSWKWIVAAGAVLAVFILGWSLWPKQAGLKAPAANSGEPVVRYGGRVVFSSDLSPVAGAVVNFANGFATDTTNGDGIYEVKLPKTMKEADLLILFNGKESVRHPLMRIDPDNLAELKIPPPF